MPKSEKTSAQSSKNGGKDRESGGAPAVTRAAAILRLLARSEEPLGVNMIAKTLGLVPSTCLHVLRALVAETFVRVDPDRKTYTLDAGLLPLAHRLMQQDDFAQRAQPHLDRIARDFAITAVGTRVIGLRHMVVLALSQPDVVFRLHVDVGNHYPALISATGRCVAAFGGHDPETIAEEFQRLEWEQPPQFAQWSDEVQQGKELGYSVDAGRYIRGITIIAAPVFDAKGTMTHAMATVGLTERQSPESIEATGISLRDAGLALSAAEAVTG